MCVCVFVLFFLYLFLVVVVAAVFVGSVKGTMSFIHPLFLRGCSITGLVTIYTVKIHRCNITSIFPIYSCFTFCFFFSFFVCVCVAVAVVVAFLLYFRHFAQCICSSIVFDQLCALSACTRPSTPIVFVFALLNFFLMFLCCCLHFNLVHHFRNIHFVFVSKTH